jgi:hypothetical protein
MFPDDGLLTWLLHDMINRRLITAQQAIEISRRAFGDTQRPLNVTRETQRANLSARIIAALQAADWINPDVDNEDLSDACRIIADVIAAKSAS